MAANPIPDPLDLKFALAEEMADGLGLHQTDIGIGQNTEVRMRAELLAARAANTEYDNAGDGKRTAVNTQTTADSAGRGFILKSVGVLKNYLGTTWSEVWEPAGFRSGSLAVPSVMAARQTLLADLRDYLAAHPAEEVAALEVTSARAATLFTALSDSRSTVNNAIANRAAKKALRTTAITALNRRMRGLIDELGQLLQDDDPRWPAFGLVSPAASEIPNAPDNVIAIPGTDPGDVITDWDDVPRATRYRVFKQVVGIDANFIPVATVFDSDATLTGLPTGATQRR